jgi:tripartite-type tricarboxylate transporter receptor subunit TctC
VEHFRSKKLRPLAVVGDKSLDIDGVGTIPALSQSLSGIKMAPNLFGIFLPSGVPDNVVATLESVWAKHIEKDASLRKYARERGALFMPSAGTKALAAIMPSVVESAWAMHAAGRTKASPESIGLAKL